jgi:hypothetical protein
MKNSLLLLCLLCLVHAQAQYSVTFQLKGLPAYHVATSPVFVTGNFNGWRSGSATAHFPSNYPKASMNTNSHAAVGKQAKPTGPVFLPLTVC